MPKMTTEGSHEEGHGDGREEGGGVPQLPTFEEIRARAYALLGDVEDELRSDWSPGTGPTRRQGRAKNEAVRAIAAAKNALNRAAS